MTLSLDDFLPFPFVKRSEVAKLKFPEDFITSTLIGARDRLEDMTRQLEENSLSSDEVSTQLREVERGLKHVRKMAEILIH